MGKTSLNTNVSLETKILIRLDYLNGLSIRKLGIKYNIKNKQYISNLVKDLIRSKSESSKLAHKLYSENFKLSEESKDKIRRSRLKYMKEHPEDTSWRKRNEPSYPEKCFIKYIKERSLDLKFTIEREKSFFPYFADFAFILLKLVVEIDGSLHLNLDRQLSDIKKDNLIRSLGWKVVRITENTVKNDWESIDKIFNNYCDINSLNIQTLKIGIFKFKKKNEKKTRVSNGFTEGLINRAIKLRKVKRPSKEILFKLIINNSFVSIGKMYGVSDNTIRNWCKAYNLPYYRQDLKHYKITDSYL